MENVDLVDISVDIKKRGEPLTGVSYKRVHKYLKEGWKLHGNYKDFYNIKKKVEKFVFENPIPDDLQLIKIIKGHLNDLDNIYYEWLFNQYFSYEWKLWKGFAYHHYVRPEPERPPKGFETQEDYDIYTSKRDKWWDDLEKWFKEKGFLGNFKWIPYVMERDKDITIYDYEIIHKFRSKDTKYDYFILKNGDGKLIVYGGWWEKVRFFVQK